MPRAYPSSLLSVLLRLQPQCWGMACLQSETHKLFGLPANHPAIRWILLLTRCHPDHISQDTQPPLNCFLTTVLGTCLLTGGKYKTGILCGRLGCASISPLGSGRWRELLMPCSLFMVPHSSNTLKFFKFSNAQWCYLLQRVTRCYSVLVTLALVLKQHAHGSVSTKQSLFRSTCNVIIQNYWSLWTWGESCAFEKVALCNTEAVPTPQRN